MNFLTGDVKSIFGQMFNNSKSEGKTNNKRKKRNYNFSIFQANDNVFKSLCLLNSAPTQKGIYFLLLLIFVQNLMSSSIENEF